MIDLFSFIGENNIYALGWTFLHSLWQGALIACLMVIALRLANKKSSNLRYWIAFSSIIAVFASALGTFFYLLPSDTASVASEAAGQIMMSEPSDLGYWFNILQDFMSSHLPTIVSLWIVGMIILSLRLAGGLIYVSRIRQQARTTDPRWQTVLDKMIQSRGLRKTVRIAESTLVSIPVALGFIKPMILFPVAAMNKLSTSEIEAIIAHELAHLVRNDYLLNILQSVIEVIFYYNPAVWWISATIRHERENCCDDMAIALCGSSLTYAKALVSLEDMKGKVPALVLPVRSSKPRLLNRVRRILNQPQNKSNTMEKLIATSGLIFSVLLFSMNTSGPSSARALDNHWLNEVSETLFLKDIEAVRDTTPERNVEVMKIKKRDDDGEVEMIVENDEITSFKIDGNEVPKDKYSEHEKLIAEMREEIEVPPLPPAPPAPALPEHPSHPPMPPLPGNLAVPPPPPPPPPAPEFKGGNGYNYFFQDGSGKAPYVIKKGDHQTLWVGPENLNGNKNMKVELKGNAIIIDGEVMELKGDNIVYQLSPDNLEHTFTWPDGNFINGNSALKFNADSIRMKIASRDVDFDFDFDVKDFSTYNWQGDADGLREYIIHSKGEDGKVSKEEYKVILREVDRAQDIVRENNLQRSGRVSISEGAVGKGNARISQVAPGSDVTVRAYNIPKGEIHRNKEAFGIYHLKTTPADRILREMEKDRLINREDDSEILLMDNKLKINGSKVSDEVHAKYKKLYEESTGTLITSKTKIELKTE